MASLQVPGEASPRPLLARNLVGRSPACGLRLEQLHVSSEHATITWNGVSWEVKDLGSRNGTFLDGSRLDVGRPAALRAGARLAFGDPDRVFELLDDEPPSATAVAQLSGAVRAARSGLLTLPDDDRPELSIYEDAAGEWWIERSDEPARSLEDGAVVQAGGQAWTLRLPFIDEGTPLMRLKLDLERMSMRFAVRRDEERVEITIFNDNVEIALEPREHSYVLLTLARARQADRDTRAPDQRGWRDRDELERMLGIDANALNLAVHRARQQLSAAGVRNAARVVEVKRGRRRFGTERFTIVPLEE